VTVEKSPKRRSERLFEIYVVTQEAMGHNEGLQNERERLRGAAAGAERVLQAGADSAYTDENGCTSLWVACYNKHEAATAELI
jgi:hypothetical protein